MSTAKIAGSVPAVWHVVDARNQIVGRLAPQIARLLSGKHKPTFVPHMDCGDWVVVINAEAAVLTGDKMKSKLYHWHTGWMGGLKTLTARQMHERAPERILEIAVKGMLAPNRLRDARMKRLRIFEGDMHPHMRQTVQSSTYAPEFMHQMAPRKFSPPAAAETGSLVRPLFEGETPERAAQLMAELETETPEQALVKLEAELARRRAAMQAAQSGELK